MQLAPRNVLWLLSATLLLLPLHRLPAQCSMGVSGIIPPENHFRVVATVLEERIPARFGQLLPVEFQQGDLLKAFGYDHFVEGRLAFGQLVQIRQLDLPHAPWLGSDSIAVVVRWFIDGHTPCRMNTRYDSLPVRSQHLFVAKLRAESLWVRGKPTLDVLPGLFTSLWAYDSAAIPDLVTLHRMLPTREAWETDCRPPVARIGEQSRHPRSLEQIMYQTLTRFREACRNSVMNHASEMEREKTRPVSREFLAVYRAQGCRDDFGPPDDAVDGRFTASPAEQWAFVCETETEKRVLIAILETSPRLIELVRMAGPNQMWSLQVASPDYFEWMDSRDFGDRRSPAPRPRRDVVLLTWLDSPPDSRTAHYESRRGWESITFHCCRGMP